MCLYYVWLSDSYIRTTIYTPMCIESIFKCSDPVQPCPFLYLAPHSRFLSPSPAATRSPSTYRIATTVDRLITASLPSVKSTASGLAGPISDLPSRFNAFAREHSSDPDPTFNCPGSNFASPPVKETRHQVMWNVESGYSTTRAHLLLGIGIGHT